MKSLLEALRKNKEYPWYKRVKWWYGDTSRELKLKLEARLVNHRGGYKCVDCGGTDTRFKNAEYQGMVLGKRMMLDFSCYHLPFSKTLCPHCLYDRIARYWDEAPRLVPEICDEFGGSRYISNTSGGVYEGDCDWFGPRLLVAEGIRGYDNPVAQKIFGKSMVIFGGGYWNGHAASLMAIKILLKETGKSETGRMVNSKMSVEGMSAAGIHIRLHSTQYTDGRITGDSQPVTEVVQGRRK
jgi:hypothetical protein